MSHGEKVREEPTEYKAKGGSKGSYIDYFSSVRPTHQER